MGRSLACVALRQTRTATLGAPLNGQTNRFAASGETLRPYLTPTLSAVLRSRLPALTELRRIRRDAHTPWR